MKSFLRNIACLGLLLGVSVSGFAFTDVSLSSPSYTSIEYLNARNVINGYHDGTFKPDDAVNRAAAVKMVLAATEESIGTAPSSAFSDVPSDAWFKPYVDYAVEKGIISGDGNSDTFSPGRQVNKAELIHMLLKAFKVTPSAYQIKTTANDLNDSQWFAADIKFALKYNITTVDEAGNVNPGKFLSRAETANIIFNMLLQGRGLDPQTLVTKVESHLITTVENLQKPDLLAAALNAAAAEKFALMVNKLLPENKTVQSVMQTVEAMKKLVSAYASGNNGDMEGVVTSAQAAWAAADASAQADPQQERIANEIKKLAGALADEARSAQEGSSE